MLGPELAILGNSIPEINNLGPEAVRKFKSLPMMNDDEATATIYELLVGVACVRKGIEVEMIAEDRLHKVPDYRINGLGGIPAVIECKRRLGLTKYELDEARLVEALYESIRWALWK